ncbi:hypothetical protein [Spiroplasma endosymbiont of Panorpa germanica]|uniref:hypothetical protein n=1 Tax=Spiroplasma endosymbiont of Panorpa germanica TaxID=3066314 RepID=UPI0030CB2C86
MSHDLSKLKEMINKDVKKSLQDSLISHKKPGKWVFNLGICFAAAALCSIIMTFFVERVLWVSVSVGLCLIFTIIANILFAVHFNKASKKLKEFHERLDFPKYYKKGLEMVTNKKVKRCLIQNQMIHKEFYIDKYSYINSFIIDEERSAFLNFQIGDNQVSYGTLAYNGRSKSMDYNDYFHISKISSGSLHDFEMYFKLKPFKLPDNHEEVDLESVEFNQCANVYSGNQVMTRKLFEPSTIKKVIESVGKKDQAKFIYLFVEGDGCFGEIKNYNVNRFKDGSLKDFLIDKDLDIQVDNIYNKVVRELKDISQILDFVGILGLYE